MNETQPRSIFLLSPYIDPKHLGKLTTTSHSEFKTQEKMNSFSVFTVKVALCCVVVMLAASPPFSHAQLDNSFYRDTCPRVHSIVREVVRNVSKSDPRILASLIRLHFHDCFVQVTM